ncbi:hypothetical protein BGZ95_003729 [Linnemannia exigua]|uniref:Uncharacterized protein n=1 Tax=Linnemannia exigua TaxID=604196 RepID=A0AAD4DHR8_9FUNG|nr:hypothetical protein BGZ95_003729 [Linnemannia exigua]
MTVDDGEMQRLWKLTNELTAQLVFNRSATLELKQQLAELQAHTTLASSPGHASSVYGQQNGGGGGGGTKESQDYALRIANERLREENSQLQEQVNEYERWMEYIMTKFRLQNLAMAQTRKDSMQEASKMAEQGNEAAYRLQEENSALQARLSDLGSVARKAIHEEYYTTESLIESLETENRSLREMLGVAEGGRGPVSGRLDFFVGNLHGLQDGDEDETRAADSAHGTTIPHHYTNNPRRTDFSIVPSHVNILTLSLRILLCNITNIPFLVFVNKCV